MEKTNVPITVKEAPFNMAIDTLQRLGGILREINIVATNPYFQKNVKQEIKIQQVKEFFRNAIPLLPVEVVKKYESGILTLAPKVRPVKESRAMNEDKLVGNTTFFSQDLDMLLDKILIELQIELQKGKYFMPPAKDSSWSR